MKDLIKAENIKTMTSTQFSEMTGMSKSNINKKIKAEFKDEIDDSIIIHQVDSRGYVTEYFLPELESKMLAAMLDKKYLKKITKFWIDQNNAPALPDLSDPNVLTGLLLENLEKVKQLELTNTAQTEKIIQDKPKVEFANTVEGTDKKISIGDMAKLSGVIGRNNLFKAMRENKIMIGQGRDKNKPFQQFISRGYFEVSETIVKRTKGDVITFTSYVTGKGQVWLMKKIIEWTK